MKKMRACFLYLLLWYVMLPSILLALPLAMKEGGIRRLRIGKLSVWGNPVFLELCKSSIERLKSLDATLYQALTQCRRVWVLQDPEHIGDATPLRIFMVNSAYLAWQSDGIIARLIYMAFCMSGFSGRHTSEVESRDIYQKVMKNSRSWLETRGFPQQLVDCYADIQNKPDAAQQAASPNGGPAKRLGNSGVMEGPPSVS